MTASPIALALLLAAADPILPPHETPAATTVADSGESHEQQLLRARELATNGQRDAALALYSTMLERSPGNTDVLLARGRTLAWMGQWQQSEADLQAVVDRSPTYADAWSALGDMYLWSDRSTQAVQAYGRWQALQPQDPDALLARARAHRSAGELDAARADFEAARALGADQALVDAAIRALEPRASSPDAAAADGYRWAARIGAARTTFRPARDGWTEQSASLRRYFERGSLGLEWLGARRFGQRDAAWALDGYVDLWTRAYANLRYQHAPTPDLFSDRSWRVELYQGVGRGWELSASYDQLDFGGSPTELYGLGVGRYVGNFYLRGRALYVPDVDSHSLSFKGLLRYYYAGNGDEYVEVTGGSGRTTESRSGAGGAVLDDSSSSASVAFVKYLTPRLGFKVGANYADNVDGYSERGISASVYTRW
ncbi:YaiO family outer membrane beta-barrel protein [Aerolutibacter ruishenii]|uniref:YaiO family outer membrane protein n=1 Tax=Aerolutibacter ruishenii TaxID=686800 RepID=A0A562M0Z4_9GAMM|nr:YaiO family outer membrane beta-barrel protein [Lysobacter ruishenii]TWI13615.1 YaiO family outer membrane protein [Lysobacter ruishenii]